MEFDPINKKIKFNKNKSSVITDTFVLDFEFIDNDEIFPCVNLCSNNDVVEIINCSDTLLM